MELTKIFRQKDAAFIALLNGVRTRQLSAADLNALNTRVSPPKNITQKTMRNPVMTLVCTNKSAQQINEDHLSKLKSEEHVFTAEVSGDFGAKSFPTDQTLRLREGAQVIMVKNDNELGDPSDPQPQRRWVNGSLGVIHQIKEEKNGVKVIWVEIEGALHEVRKQKWERMDYTYNEDKKKIDASAVGTFIQYPIKLAWAMTIHRAQGQTFDRIVVDLGYGAFAHGQTYVALSRCRSLAGIHLLTYVRFKDIILDPRVIQFLDACEVLA